MVVANALNITQGGVVRFDGASAFTGTIEGPGSSNIGIAYSAGTFTVQGANGSALSSTNVGYITLQSKANPGRLVTIPVTANQTFTDGSAGTTDNQRFGLVTAVNWASDMPFYLYAVMDDTEALINFMIGRAPTYTPSPTSTSIGKTGAVVNSAGQLDVFSLGNITVTSYDNNPCICIGSFRMQFVGATDSWTVQTLTTSDGIGQFNEQTRFTYPTGVNGAASGTYFFNNAGTEPAFTGAIYNYTVSRSGWVYTSIYMPTISVAGVGANNCLMTVPYANQASNVYGYTSCMYFFQNSTGVNYQCKVQIGSSTSATSLLIVGDLTNVAGGLTNALFTAGCQLMGQIIYKPF